MTTENTEPTSSSRMHARLVNTAAEVIARAMENGRQTPAGWAVALDSACLLQSPETAAELASLRARLTTVHRMPQDTLTPAEVRLGQYRRPPRTFETGSERDLYDIAAGLQAALGEVREQRDAARLRAAELTSVEALSPERLAGIAAREQAATAGPWCTDAWEIYQGTEYVPGISLWIGETCRGTGSPQQDRADAEFAAHAREDVPALLADNGRLRTRVAELEKQLAEYERPADEDPITYTLTDKTPDDVTPQVAKLRALLAGQREQAGGAS